MAVEIADWNDLDNVRNDPTDDYVLVNDLDNETAGYTGIGDDWTPIKSFGGSLDGQGNSISNLIVDTTDRVEDTPCGFFETWDTDRDVTVKNLSILDAVVKNETEASAYTQTPEAGSGLLVGAPWDDGFSNDSKRTIENCTFTGSVEGTLSGGITSAFVVDDESSITDCIVDVDIVSTDGCGGVIQNGGSGAEHIYENILVNSNLTVLDSGFRCGGFMGNGGGDTKNVACFTDITIETDVIAVGGLIGEHNPVATIENCYAYGSISGTADDIGGLVGVDDHTGGGTNTIENSYAAVSLEDADATNLGGVIGRIEDETTITVSDAYWDEEKASISDDGSSETIPLTTSEMQGSEAETNMDGFDFANVWDSILESDGDTTADGYPILLALDRERQLNVQGVFAGSNIYRVVRDGEFVERTVFDVDPVVDTANPFGDYAVIKMDDSEGKRFEQYARGTRVDVEVSENSGITFENRFTGYVVERRETEQSGADVLEVEAYSFDQFLRRNTVTNDQRGNTITEALADIIQTDTPVTFDPALVEVGDDQELTRTYQGEAVETVLRDLAFKSNNEDFGVNDDLEFFFRERETTHIDRGIDNTQWFNYDIPELGKEAINEVEVWYDDGDESVIVDDGTDKLDLQDSLGLPDPGTQRAELNRPLITDINDAEDEGRKFLEFKNATLSGTVTTFGLFDARPGDTIDIEIAPRGIDDEFVIAAVEYRWGVDETILTIVEKRGDVDDILSELNESVQRVEMEGADRDAPKNRITTTDAGAIVGVDVTPDPHAVRFVNDGRRAVRDTWTGDDPPDIATLVVGDDGTGLSRSNSSLRNQTNSASVTQTLPDDTSVTFEASVTQTGVREIGLETADGRLVARAVYESPIDLDGAVSVTLDVSNDASVSRGVLTTAGQTAVRDVLADNSPTIPNAYAYGDDDTAVSESDTALGNELVEVSLDEILIQDADTQAEWDSLIGDVADDVPFTVDATGPRTTKISNTREGENSDNSNSSGTVTDGDYSGGEATGSYPVIGEGFDEWIISFEHDIPASEVGIAVRIEQLGDNTEWRLTFNGVTIDEGAGEEFALQWLDLSDGGFFQEFSSYAAQGGDDLQGGETYTLRLEAIGNANDVALDVLSIYDRRYSADLTFDDSNDGAGGFLDGPERFPELIERSLSTASTRRNVTEANFVSSWNDTSGEQYVELANDGSTFTRVNNVDTGSVTFAEPDRGVDVNIGFGRWSETSDQTPLNGNDPQQIDTWSLSADPDATVSDDVSAALTRAIVPPDTLAPGATLREAGLKSGSTLLTRHVLAEFDVLEGQRISSSETTRFTGEN